MTGNPLEFWGPDLGYWDEAEQDERQQGHVYVVEAPPPDGLLADDGSGPNAAVIDHQNRAHSLPPFQSHHAAGTHCPLAQ
jgi:hypothetical protein